MSNDTSSGNPPESCAEPAYAKLNLALHVRRKRADGYHDIETLFAFCEDGDELIVRPAEDLALFVSGPFGGELLGEAAEDNLVMRAARALQAHTGQTGGAALTLIKRLPVGSGVGGGSADAAATLRLLSRFWSLDLAEAELEALGAELGADVPACLRSCPARGEGTGTHMQPAELGALAGKPVLLINPGVHVSTPQIFRAWDGVDRGALGVGDALQIARSGRNDLTSPACALVPEIHNILELLGGGPPALLARMSGSGATCFAVYEGADNRDLMARRIETDHPNWWVMRSRLR